MLSDLPKDGVDCLPQGIWPSTVYPIRTLDIIDKMSDGATLELRSTTILYPHRDRGTVNGILPQRKRRYVMNLTCFKDQDSNQRLADP